MAAFTSTQSGNWANPTTWGNAGPPGDGDTATIANTHTVTIAAGTAVTVGNPADMATYAVRTAGGGGTGILIVDVGASLTIKSHVLQGNATWQINAGATVTFTHATVNLFWQIADGNLQANAKLLINGTVGSLVTVQSSGGVNSAGFGWTGINWSRSGQMQATGTRFLNIGIPGGALLNAMANVATYVAIFTDCQFTSCGVLATTANMPVGGVFKLTRCTFRTPIHVASQIVQWLLGAGAHTNNIVFDRVVWEGTLFISGLNATGLQWNEMIGSSYGSGNAMPLDCTQSAVPAATVTGLYLFNKLPTSGNPSNLPCGSLTNVCAMRYGVFNGHSLHIVPHVDSVVNGGVWEQAIDDESGDSFGVTVNPPTLHTLEIENIIHPPGPDGVRAAGSFIVIPFTGTASNLRLNVHHCTSFVSATGATPGGCLILENVAGFAGMVSAFRDNIFYRATAGNGWAIYQDPSSALVDGSLTNVDYNDKFNLTTDGYNSVDAKFAAPSPPGPHDLTVDPQFHDASRRFLTWGQSINPALADVQAVFNELFKRNDAVGYNPAFTIDAYIIYMRGGFYPQNQALANAAHDGSDIGPVPVARVHPYAGAIALASSLTSYAWKEYGPTELLDHVVEILTKAGVGIDNQTIFRTSKAQIPTGVGPYLTVTETGGSGPEGTHNAVGLPAYLRPTVSILVRGQSTGATRDMIKKAYAALVAFGQRSQAVQGVWYRGAVPLQEPFDTGTDGAGRFTMTVNFAFVKRPNAAMSR